VGAAVEVAVCLYAVSDHLDAAILAGRREGVDCTLEAVEGARSLTGHAYLKSLVILISTNFALGHIHLLLLVFSFLPKQDNSPFWDEYPGYDRDKRSAHGSSLR
jgi:hypothetical protein